MLSLNDPRWTELQHAYGPAGDIPALLTILASRTAPSISPNEEPWMGLWSSLCHQGDVYSASYAAVPHIVQIAMTTTSPITFSFYQLPTCIEIARLTGHGSAIPGDLQEDYHRSVASLIDCISLHRQDTWDRQTLLAASAAQAVSKGHIDIAEALMNLDDDIIARINNFDFD